MKSILLIDDDEQITDVLDVVLESQGYSIQSCSSPGVAVEMLANFSFSLILLDLRLGEYNGLDLLPKLRETDPDVPIFIITAHGDVDSAVAALTQGADGYIRKPFEEGDLKEQIARAIENYEMRRALRNEKTPLPYNDARNIIRCLDHRMETTLKRIARASQVSSNVVVTGESGTGKELVARALHQCGPRRDGPFVALNCAALPENLLESELFGYQRGAFTDARENKPGLFVRANGGTLFLDEVGDAPLSIQAKLLRVLQEREVLPLGASAPIKIDVRIVAATHKSLQAEVEKGAFRQDLFYRLHVIPIHVPPLRERNKDIVFLADFFARKIAGDLEREFDGFTPGAIQALESHPWPGNVRELQNRVEYALILATSSKLTVTNLFPERPEPLFDHVETPVETPTTASDELPPNTPLPTFQEAKNSFERTYLERVLSVAKGNITKAASLASKSRTEVYGLLRKHRLDPLNFKRADGGKPER
jgi:two-component system response regulator GlrR